MKKREAFTLIELIAVLVILAILALIVTPLVLNIIRKARTSADKRSIDAYGRSIELAIADYLLDNGTFPTSIKQLTIEYTGDKVVCNTTTLNEDGGVYLAECTVNGRNVEGYTYGKNKKTYEKYSKGDYVLYNNIGYFVIEDSDSTNDTVKLLKAIPLTYREMGMAESDDYGQVQFGESTDYSKSNVKQKVDAWASTAVKDGDSATARLIKLEELIDNLGYKSYVNASGEGSYNKAENTPDWVYNSKYKYWTMGQVEDSSDMWIVNKDGNLEYSSLSNDNYVRPVLELNKSTDITASKYVKSYSVGDEVTYNNVNYYVIEDSNETKDTVTMLKAKPLTVVEVNQYGAGHVNEYTNSSKGTAYDSNGYGGMAYYSNSSGCGGYSCNNCVTDYLQSEIKYVVDAWASDKVPTGLVEARLIKSDELMENLGYNKATSNTSYDYVVSYSLNTDYTPDWVYNSKYKYWTMTPSNSSKVYNVSEYGELSGSACACFNEGTVRPVIVLSKSVLD